MSEMSTQQLGEAIIVFEFIEDRGWAGSQPLVGIAPEAIVLSHLPIEELAATFGGCVKYADASTGQTYLGVWGRRKVKRFINLLREQGLVVGIDTHKPEHVRQLWRQVGQLPK